MQETSIIERPSQIVESVNDFSLLKKIVSADQRGCLFAVKVKITLDLNNESYAQVRDVMSAINQSQTVYEFLGVRQYSIKTKDDWDNLKAALIASPGDAPKLHALSELDVSEADFEEMRRLLSNSGGLLLGVKPESSQVKMTSVKVASLH